MPTPPKESIGGTKGHQIAAWEMSKTIYDYLRDLTDFSTSVEFEDEPAGDQELIFSELTELEKAYEILNARVANY